MPDLPRPATGLDADIRQAQNGDEAAFRSVYRTLGPRLLVYIRAVVGDADAEDVAAEAWAAIARDLHRFRGDEDGFRGWAVTIARHRALDHLRRRRPADPLPDEDLPVLTAPDDPSAEALDSISTSGALRLIRRLPPDQARAILLQIVIGLDSTTAGRILGKKPDSVRAATHRGLRGLERLLQAAMPPSPRDDVAQSSASPP